MICTFKIIICFVLFIIKIGCSPQQKNHPIAHISSSYLPLSSYLTLSCRTIPLVTKTFRYYFHDIFSIGMVNTLLAIFIKNELVIHNDAFFYPVKKNNDNSFKEQSRHNICDIRREEADYIAGSCKHWNNKEIS